MRGDAQLRVMPGAGLSILEALGFEGEYPTLL
jgi:hypothetical protein